MTLFQLLLFAAVIAIFYIFFKKLFSEDYPKRGVDFEAKNPDRQIGGISTPDKIFSKPVVKPSRSEELLTIADESVAKGDMLEAKKALQSLLALDAKSPNVLKRYAYVLSATNDFLQAKEYYREVLKLDAADDVAHAALANVLHRLGEDDEAIAHHQKSIELDSGYAAHSFNYANTLYELGKEEEALGYYQEALRLDPTLEDAAEMIGKLQQGAIHE
jgi:tetratricopeptide (TPR) repeat protein